MLPLLAKAAEFLGSETLRYLASRTDRASAIFALRPPAHPLRGRVRGCFLRKAGSAGLVSQALRSLLQTTLKKRRAPFAALRAGSKRALSYKDADGLTASAGSRDTRRLRPRRIP
jgi:hypothetical protein